METIATIVKWAKKGDETAFAEIFNLFHNRVYYFVLNHVKFPQDAEDIVQNTFVEVFKSINSLSNETAFKSWLYTITQRQIFMLYRKNGRGAEEFIEGAADMTDDYGEFLPDNILESDEMKTAVMDLIGNLPEPQKTAVLFHYFEEMSVKDIAEIEACPVGTIKSRLNYARKYIKSEIEKRRKTGNYVLSVAPVPLLTILLREISAQNIIPQATATKIFSESCASAGIKLSANVAATASAKTCAASATSATTASAASGAIFSVNAILCGAACVVASCAVFAGVMLNIFNNSQEETEYFAPAAVIFSDENENKIEQLEFSENESTEKIILNEAIETKYTARSEIFSADVNVTSEKNFASQKNTAQTEVFHANNIDDEKFNDENLYEEIFNEENIFDENLYEEIFNEENIFDENFCEEIFNEENIFDENFCEEIFNEENIFDENLNEENFYEEIFNEEISQTNSNRNSNENSQGSSQGSSSGNSQGSANGNSSGGSSQGNLSEGSSQGNSSGGNSENGGSGSLQASPSPSPIPSPSPTSIPTPIPTPTPSPEPAEKFTLTISVDEEKITRGENFSVNIELKNIGEFPVEIIHHTLFWPQISDWDLHDEWDIVPAVLVPHERIVAPDGVLRNVNVYGDDCGNSWQFGNSLPPGTHELKFFASFVYGDEQTHVQIFSNVITLIVEEKFPTPVGFCDNDYQKLVALALQDEDNMRWFEPFFAAYADVTAADDLTQHDYIVWNNDSPRKIISLFFEERGLTGAFDLSDFTALGYLYSKSDTFTEINLSNTPSLQSLRITPSPYLKTLDVSESPALKFLRVTDISEIDLSNNLALESLDIGGHQLAELDLSNNHALTTLTVGSSVMTELDLSNNLALKKLRIETNPMTEINLSNNLELEVLQFVGVPLTQINLSNNFALKSLEISDSALAEINLTNNHALENLWITNSNLTSLAAFEHLENLNSFGFPRNYIDMNDSQVQASFAIILANVERNGGTIPPYAYANQNIITGFSLPPAKEEEKEENIFELPEEENSV
ncbi:MAG: sigma-70 family RNA polymerase sigma factor [Defluviitaleaceae bacterium]|nr:sigma-70 family RNA polymerase sigma factor [Defluviitaleaceae bacterium]